MEIEVKKQDQDFEVGDCFERDGNYFVIGEVALMLFNAININNGWRFSDPMSWEALVEKTKDKGGRKVNAKVVVYD